MWKVSLGTELRAHEGTHPATPSGGTSSEPGALREGPEPPAQEDVHCRNHSSSRSDWQQLHFLSARVRANTITANPQWPFELGNYAHRLLAGEKLNCRKVTNSPGSLAQQPAALLHPRLRGRHVNSLGWSIPGHPASSEYASPSSSLSQSPSTPASSFLTLFSLWHILAQILYFPYL